MRVALACDHGGYELKQSIKQYLQSTTHAYVDLGCDSTESVNYPDYAEKVVHYVSHNGYDYGILICGTGQGMAMCSNKHRNIRASLCTDANMAELARSHGNSNILCMGGRITMPIVAVEMLEVFLTTDFVGGRHLHRINKFSTVCDK
jgi:RpiB/LacA/LacB family sugar-phosphate isomerase